MTSIKQIPFFNYPRLYKDNKEDYLRIFDEVCSKGAFILQKDVEDFENNLGKFLDVKHTIGVANATDGLEISWMSLNLKKGDEVICCSHTMLATASSIKLSGGVPIPVELGEDNLIDPDAVEASINSKTVGIMPTQLNGRTCDMERIMAIARKNKLFVVEDAAQALGSKFNNKCAGTFGNASAISFYPAKVLGCFGDAGAVLTNDNEIYKKLYELHDHGRDKNGDVKSWGRNSRLDNLQAAILNFKLQSYPKVIHRRREIASLYQKSLESLHELKLPPAPNSDPRHFDVYQNYEIEANKRDNLKTYLHDNGIGTLIQWGGKGVHQFTKLGFNKSLPISEKIIDRMLLLPINMTITDDEVKYVSDKINSFYS